MDVNQEFEVVSMIHKCLSNLLFSAGTSFCSLFRVWKKINWPPQ